MTEDRGVLHDLTRRRAVRGVHAGSRSRRSSSATRSPRTSTSRSSARACRAWSWARSCARPGLAGDRADRQGRRDRRHLVLEPVPGRDVRRRVVHLHADARGDELRPDDALRVRRRDPAAPRRDRRRSTASSTTRCSTPASRRSEWDESRSRWVIRTDRGDEIRAAVPDHGASGILNLMKLPAIPGMDEFEGTAFHTARWDYEYTGGGPDDPRLTKLADKVVGVIGVGRERHPGGPAARRSRRSTCTCSSARRRPSASAATARPTTSSPSSSSPGWQRERMENFSAVMIGRPVERDLVDDGWTLPHRAAQQPGRRARA